MKILVDMSLSPQYVPILVQLGFEAVHWSQIGEYHAADSDIFEWARENGHVVLTHDLDFGDILAATNANAPSVIQIRTQDVSPQTLAPKIKAILDEFEPRLAQGALIVLEDANARYRILPLLHS